MYDLHHVRLVLRVVKKKTADTKWRPRAISHTSSHMYSKYLVALLALAAQAAAMTDLQSRLEAQLTPIINELGQHYNTSVQYGFRSGDTLVSLAAGPEDRATGAPVQPTSLIPLGSITKSWTAVSVMQLVEKGVIGLDDPAHIHADPFLKRENGTTLLDLWAGDETIHNVTVHMLLHMTSGINDYDNNAYEKWTMSHPDGELTPYDYLHQVDKHWVFQPGQGAAYSSVGYVLLGIVAAAKTGAPHWQDFDQLGALPPALRASGYFNHTKYVKIPQNTISDQTRCIAQLWPASSHSC